MSPRMRILIELALAMGLLVPGAMAQKPPAPPPPPSAPAPRSPGRAANFPPPTTQPGQPAGDLVMFLRGHVATDDGTPVPNDVMVERTCYARVRQQIYVSSSGDFSMDLATRTDTYVDATGEGNSQTSQANGTNMGISRRELTNCELRATATGFRSDVLSLIGLDPISNSVDVGAIVMHRTTKIKGMTVSAAEYQAPKDARKAYESGLDAEKHGRDAEARQFFEKAVAIYPKYATAWFQLGSVLQKVSQKEPARTAYERATAIDSKFLPPYMSLAEMAFADADWTQLLNLTNHVMDLDPLRYSDVTGYIVDLDPLDYAEVYFYNSAANYQLNKIEDAEKSGLRAERLDVRPRYPQLHLLLAEIFSRKSDYTSAILETTIYLQMVPHAKNAQQVREQLAKLQKLNGAAPAGEKTDQN